jgi:hypothetical protein
MALDLGNAIAELRGSLEALRVTVARRAAEAAKARVKAKLERELRRNAPPPSPPSK